MVLLPEQTSTAWSSFKTWYCGFQRPDKILIEKADCTGLIISTIYTVNFLTNKWYSQHLVFAESAEDDHGVGVATDVRKKVRTLPSAIWRPIGISRPASPFHYLASGLFHVTDLYRYYWEYCQISSLQCTVKDLSTRSRKNHLFVQDIRMHGFLSRLFLTVGSHRRQETLGPLDVLWKHSMHQRCQSEERIIVPVTPSSKLEKQTSGNIWGYRKPWWYSSPWFQTSTVVLYRNNSSSFTEALGHSSSHVIYAV